MADPGEGPGGGGGGAGPPPPPRPPISLDQTEATRAEKVFWENATDLPLSQGLDDRTPPLSEGLDPPLD